MTLLARDVMKKKVVSVPETMDLRDLAKLFLENSFSGAPVVDDDGNLVGVISQTDLIYYNMTRDDELVMDSHFYQAARVEGQHIPRGFQIEDTNTGCVADVMTPVVHSVTETANLDAVTRLMLRKHIHRVVVRSGRKVSGIISALDLLRASRKQDSAANKKTAKKTTKKKAAGKKVVKNKTARKRR